MATVQGIRTAQARIVALWSLSRAEHDRLSESASQWSALCRDVSDEEILRRIVAHTGEPKPPTLSQLLGPTKSTSSGGAEGCTGCDGGGRRQVLRWVDGAHGPVCQELTVRCPCAAGEPFRSSFPIDLPTWMERWTRSSHTIDGPYADPDPAHRVPAAKRRAFELRATTRRDDVQAFLAGERVA